MNKIQTYSVNMIAGADGNTPIVSTFAADSPATAALEAEMKWPGVAIQIINVEGPDGCDAGLCKIDDHWCCNCDYHLENDLTCTNCDFTRD